MGGFEADVVAEQRAVKTLQGRLTKERRWLGGVLRIGNARHLLFFVHDEWEGRWWWWAWWAVKGWYVMYVPSARLGWRRIKAYRISSILHFIFIDFS